LAGELAASPAAGIKAPSSATDPAVRTTNKSLSWINPSLTFAVATRVTPSRASAVGPYCGARSVTPVACVRLSALPVLGLRRPQRHDGLSGVRLPRRVAGHDRRSHAQDVRM
jgi:hypothetical protein